MDFTAYLQDLPREQLDHLYNSPWTCQAVLRALPPLCQHVLLLLLFPAEPLPRDYVHQSILPAAATQRDKALEQLWNLQLLSSQSGHGHYSLNRTFQTRLQQSVISPLSVGVPAATAGPTSITSANSFGDSQWQKVLLVLVDGHKASLKPHASLTPLDIRTLLCAAGLVDDSLELTDSGFHFLFLDVYSQLWKLLQQYLTQLQNSPRQSLPDALSFLLQLSFRKVR
jgi:transcription initiation factor TFIIH subunit 4